MAAQTKRALATGAPMTEEPPAAPRVGMGMGMVMVMGVGVAVVLVLVFSFEPLC
jgi:hypothetical protein